MRKMLIASGILVLLLVCTLLSVSSVTAVDAVTPDFSSVTVQPYPLTPYSGNPVITASMVTDRAAKLVADPFLFHEGNTWYLFFEVDSGVQEIGLATSSDGLHWTYQGIVIAGTTGHWHFAYPYVFNYNGNYYMTPDTYDQDSIGLYQASNFPYGWTLKSVLVRGAKGSGLCDPQPFVYNGMWWMFVGDSSDANCYLYYSTSLTGPWIQHPKSPIVSNNVLEARGAGRVVQYGKTILRFVEQFTNGVQVGAFQVDTLTTAAYAEHEIPASPLFIPSGSGWNANGMHQLDPWWTGTTWLAVTDGSNNNNVWSIGIYTTGETSTTPATINVSITYQPFGLIMQYMLKSGSNWTAPSTITVWGRDWQFLKWSDGPADKTRTFNGNGSYSITYG
jgi:hypothetical protein